MAEMKHNSMWEFDNSGKIVGMNLNNIPEEEYICHKCNKNYIATGHKSLCEPCLMKSDNQGVYLLLHLTTGDKYIGKSRTLSSRVLDHIFRSGSGSTQIATISTHHYCLWLFVQLSTEPNDEGWWIEEVKPSLNKAGVKNRGIKDLETALDSKNALGDRAYLLNDLNIVFDKIARDKQELLEQNAKYIGEITDG